MPRWRYTTEDDDLIRVAFAPPHGSPERVKAIQTVADALGRTVEAVRSHHVNLMVREARHTPTERRPFTDDEDVRILGLGPRPASAAWVALGRSLNRPVSSMRHRLHYLRDTQAPIQAVSVQRRRSIPLPVAQPTWFEHQITRERLMAGR
jgi:hypothetical protein